MSKEEFMYACWKKRLTATEMIRHAFQMGLPPELLPSRMEYLNFYREADDSYQNNLE